MRNLIFISMLALSLTSCFEEEMMVPPHQQGDLEEGQAAQGPDYSRQIFYDLNRNMEVASNVISDWDLCFESSTGGWLIRLNSSKFMVAGNTNDTTFGSEIDESGLEMRFDPSNGNPDSTAIGAWFEDSGDSIWSLGHVYLVDRGMDEHNRQVGSKKVRFDIQGKDYMVRHADPDNNKDTVVVIRRDKGSDRIYFSFENGIVDIAPEPDDWSLLFSKYTTMLVTNVGDNYPYLVTGVMLNPNGVAAALDTIHEFTSIELGDTIDLQLTTHADVIGYDWKYYNFDDAVYTIVPGQAYLIRDRDGFYYKLRFIDFYNDTGEKGYPGFEYVRL